MFCLTDGVMERKAYRLFNESSYGVPRLDCYALQQQWQTSLGTPFKLSLNNL